MDMDQSRSRKSIKFVYSERYSAFGRKAGVILHRIIHRTPTTLYIDSNNEYPYGWCGLGIQIVFTLRRAELENDGRAWSDSQRRFFYVLPMEDEDIASSPETFDEDRLPDFVKPLGLSIPFDIEDIENAYRQRVKQAHPDRGGDIEEFIHLREQYENALAFFRQA